jgi:NADPH:quinone reductase-like Zn-dependent oxidoreductase
MTGAPKEMWKVFMRLFKAFAWPPFLRQKFKFFIANINRHDLTTFCSLIEGGKVIPVIDRRYTLQQTGDALAYVEGGHAGAKVLIMFQ